MSGDSVAHEAIDPMPVGEILPTGDLARVTPHPQIGPQRTILGVRFRRPLAPGARRGADLHRGGQLRCANCRHHAIEFRPVDRWSLSLAPRATGPAPMLMLASSGATRCGGAPPTGHRTATGSRPARASASPPLATGGPILPGHGGPGPGPHLFEVASPELGPRQSGREQKQGQQ